MTISVLGVHQRGTTNGLMTVVRQAGASAVQVGRAFSYLSLTTIVGTLSDGDTITGGTSGAVGIITAHNGSANLFVSITNGAFTVGEPISNGLGGTATVNSIGMTANASGLFEPEPTATTNTNFPCNRVVVFRNEVYCALGLAIFKLVGLDWTPVHILLYGSNPSAQLHFKTGLRVFYVNDQPLLAIIYGGTAASTLRRAKTLDGITWSDIALNGIGNLVIATNGVLRDIVWNNVLYFHCNWNDGNTGTGIWNPATDSITRNTTSLDNCTEFMIFKGQLLALAHGGSFPTPSHMYLVQWLSGSWQVAIDLTDLGNITGGGSPAALTAWAMWAPGDGFLYLAAAVNNNPPAGWVVKKIQYSGGVFSDVTPNTGPGKTIGPTVFAGTGIPLWTSGGSTNSPDGGRIQVTVDDVTNPGTPDVYFYYAPNDTVGTQVTTMKWNGPSSAVTLIGQGGDVANALAHTKAGGGERIWNSGRPDILITNIVSSVSGETISYIAYGGGTVNVTFYFSQDGEPPATQCLLAGNTGGTLVGNQVNGVSADGTTVNTVLWTPLSQGVTNLTNVQVEPVIL
jgi:hypothetical protein